MRARFRLVVVPDDTPRSIAAKLLDRPDLLQALRTSFRDRPVFIEPWNVTDREVEVAPQLQAPIDGAAPHLWPPMAPPVGTGRPTTWSTRPGWDFRPPWMVTLTKPGVVVDGHATDRPACRRNE